VANTPVIRTPDQRLRVFVSSTLDELANERRTVRDAVERLRLAAVMFELGARPHPPRELYRAYLEQSHVFVGIYWQRYGWMAPGEEVSGLEDEYRLAARHPRLLYIKEPAPEREQRLSGLLARFTSDDRATYRRFSTTDELARLVQDDLAVLLSERFETSAPAAPPGPAWALPAPATAILGRDREVAETLAAFDAGRRLVTLTGVGGVGKTRLALEVASRLAGSVETAFVPLAAVDDCDRALRVVADQLGARSDGSRSALEAVAAAVRGRPATVVLDNLEQIPDIGGPIAELLFSAPQLRILATSRRALRVRAELEVNVAPLTVPSRDATPEALAGEPAVRLFVDRARAVAARIAVDPGSLATIAEICRRVEGIPLAIELAAARARLLSPAELLARLGDHLSSLVGGGADLPERQRTLRAAIDWSHQLLRPPEQALFARLGVFTGGFTVEAAEAVCGDDAADVLEPLGALLDGSLITSVDEPGSRPRFTMFETVRQYAVEQLDRRGEADARRGRHLAYHARLAEQAQPYLCGPGQREWVARLDPERPNFRHAVTTALAHGEHATVVEMAWDVIVLYFVRDAVDEPAAWLRSVAEAHPELDEVTAAKLRSLHALTRIHHGEYDSVDNDLDGALAVFRREQMSFESAVALHQIGFVRYRLHHDPAAALAALETSSALFDAIGHDWGIALAEAMRGSILAAEGDLTGAEASQRRSLDHARAIDNEQQVAQALQQLAFTRLLGSRDLEAFALLDEAADLLRRQRLRTDTTYSLEALALVALNAGDLDVAAEAVTVAEAERARLGIAPWPSLEPSIDLVVRRARTRLGEAEFEARRRSAADRELFETLTATIAALRPITRSA
jgi:predicted ATPase